MTNETIILRELHRRSKLKEDARCLSYRELETEPFCMNSPSSHMSRLRKKYKEIRAYDRINTHTQKDYKVFKWVK
jgi:hypothetical protein